MSAGEELQRLNMVEALPRLFSDGDPTCIDKVVPRLQQALPGDGAEFHMIASNTFRTILEQKLVPPSTFTQTFLTSIVACIDSREPYTAKAWLETLLDIIDLLPQNVVKNDILPIAVARGQLSQPIQSRVTSCELLGKLATKFDCTQIQKEIVPLVHSLCQDVSGDVRGSMCHQLPFIARGLSPEAVKPALFPLLVELAVDEEQYVRIAAVHSISELVVILPGDVLKHTIIPLLKKLCDQAMSQQDRVLCAISEKFGELCVGLKNFFLENEVIWFITFFKEMSKLGSGKQPLFHEIKNVSDLVREKEHADLLLQCRLNCAYNFPGIAQFTGPAIFEDMLHSTFTSLSCDHSFYVRRTLAGGVHEVLKVLGPRCLLLRAELFILLSDESHDVLQALVPNLSSILDHLFKIGIVGPFISDGISHELLRSALKCEGTLSLSNDWRLHSTMLAQLESFAKILPCDLIFSNLPVVLFHRIQDSRALPCRLAAARLLLVVLRHTSKLENQNEIRNRIFTELCIHHSCHTRLLFVKMCGMALDIFSSYYFKEHFFLRLLSLAGDPIPNVRLVLCGLLPRLQVLLKLPHDSSLLAALQEAVERLQNPHRPDKDVSSKLEAACAEMENIAMNGVGQEFSDAEDIARYQEEQHIEMSSVSEPRRLVTVNMKTLGEGKRATLVSLRGPEVSRTDLRQTSHLMSRNDGNLSSNVAVSSVGLLGGHAGNESRITASISSTTSESAPSFNAFSSLKKEPDPGFSSTITLVGNDIVPNYRALTQINSKKEQGSNFSSFAANQKVTSSSSSTSWSQPLPLTPGSRLPLPAPLLSKTNKTLPKASLKPVLSLSELSEFDVTAVYMLISHFDSDRKMPSFSDNGASMQPPSTSTSSSSSTSSLLSSSYPALLEEEFYIDAGVPLPEQLTVAKISSTGLLTSESVSKIPSLRELLFQNSTLLAQVANRTAASESAAKSLSYAKSYNSSKTVEHSASGSTSNSSKRFSRIFEENATDLRYSSLIGRPSSASSRKDNGGNSLLPKPSSVTGLPTDTDSASRPIKESSPALSAKMLPNTAHRTNPTRKDSKIGTINRRSMIFYSSPGNDTDGTDEKDRSMAGAMRNGKHENSGLVNHHHSSSESYDGIPSKLSNNSSSKFSSRPSAVTVGQNVRGGVSRNPFGLSKVSSVKSTSHDTSSHRYSSLEAPFSQIKDKSAAGQTTTKRYSLGEKVQGTVGPVDKKVSLSSIGVRGIRRSLNSTPRPHSCFILTQQNDKPNGTNSRSMSQESLGMDQSRVGSRLAKRAPTGYNRSEARQSRIPRGGTSCHSSPGNSRSTSPVHGYIHTAPCSARASRSSSPTDMQPSRVSLASIKLHEPSRLPIRKYNHHL